MAAEKSTAIVLRLVDFSETSCVVTLLTREFGKITALAKGARRRKSPFEAALDLLAVCRIVFLHKSSGAMDLLTEAKLDRRFRSASTDLNRLYVGYYILELLAAMTENHDPHPDVFDLANETIAQIDGVNQIRDAFEEETNDGIEKGEIAEINLAEVLLQFELQLITLLGHAPMLTQCVSCGREKKDEAKLRRVSFGLNEGGILCSKCLAGKQNVVSLSSGGYLSLKRLVIPPKIADSKPKQDSLFPSAFDKTEQDTNQGETNDEVDSEGSDKFYGEVRQLINNYISHLLGYRPRLLKFVSHLTK